MVIKCAVYELNIQETGNINVKDMTRLHHVYVCIDGGGGWEGVGSVLSIVGGSASITKIQSELGKEGMHLQLLHQGVE